MTFSGRKSGPGKSGREGGTPSHRLDGALLPRFHWLPGWGPSLERLNGTIRYCARGPFALDRLHLVGGRSDKILYLLPKPDPSGRTALRLSALEWPPLTALPQPPLRRAPLRSGSWTAWPRFSLPSAPATFYHQPQGLLGSLDFLSLHCHYHLCVVDGLFEQVEGKANQDPSSQTDGLRFHQATTLTSQLLESLQHTVRKRVLRHFRRQALLEPHEAEDMITWDHGSGFSLEASVRIEATDRDGHERLIRCCAQPPFAVDRPNTQFRSH